jgi:hypothetical protein
MLTDIEVKDAVHVAGRSRKEQALCCLALSPAEPRSVSDVRAIALRTGVKGARSWNVADTLARLDGLAIRTDSGWELTKSGRQEVVKLSGASVQPRAASSLRQLLQGLSSGHVKSFVEEAVGSVEAGHFRAAVVLSWVGAMAVLYELVLSKHLTDFNAEAKRRNAKWKEARTADDLARMTEYDFLQTIESVSIIGKNVKAELEACLKLRNGCGHPSSLKVAAHRVSSHVEVLVLNVFAKFC